MKKILFISVSFTSILLTSCLKDKNIEDRKYGTQGLGEIPLVLFPSAQVTTGLDASDKDTSFHLVTVRLAEANPAAEDVKVTLTPNNAAVTAAGFAVAPTSAYKLDNLVVTIPKGQREGYVTITTKTSNLTDDTYGFGFDIASVSNPKYTIASTLKTTVIGLPIKNRWDGHYEVTGSFVDNASSTITGYYPLEWDLVTSGGSQVVVYDRDYTGTPTHIIQSGTSLSQYGSYGLVVNFDPATNKITSITNYYGQFSGSFQRSAALDPTGVNAYDPATKTIKIKYFMQQGNPAAVRTSFNETWTYVGPR